MANYLSFAQSNGHMLRLKQGGEPTGYALCQRVGNIQDNVDDMLLMVKPKPPTAMADIAYEAHDTPAAQPRHIRTQPVPSPYERIVGQRGQLGDHLRGCEALLMALRQPQPFLIAFERRFDATSSLIIQIDIGEQDSAWIVEAVNGLLAEDQHLRGRQRRNQHAHPPLAILLAARHCYTPDGTTIGVGGVAHPADLAAWHARVGVPRGHALGQTLGPRPRI